MLIEKVSILTGKKNVMDIDVTENRYSQWIKEKTGGHYGDEIVFSALYEYCGNHKEISC